MEGTEYLILMAKSALAQSKAAEVMEILQDSKLDDNSEVLYLKGEASYRLQNWGESINYFRDFQSKNPDDKKAQAYIEMIQNILTFYHKDHFNP